MDDFNKLEKNFFTNLQKQFKTNDLIKLDDSFVPKNSNNRVNRFYSSKDSIWFSRLNINDDEKIYYFGRMDNINPSAIFKYDSNSKNSSIKFIKDNVAILVKIKDSKVFNEANHLFNLRYASKNKSSGYYFIVLGKINSEKLMKNIEILIKNFVFEVNFNKAVSIINYTGNNLMEDIGEVVDNVNYLDVLKFNLNVINIKNAISTKDFSYSDAKKIKEFLFSKNDNGDYIFNPEFRNKFDKSDEELFEALNEIIPLLNNTLSYESVEEKIIQGVELYKEVDITSILQIDEPDVPTNSEDDTEITPTTVNVTSKIHKFDSPTFKPGIDIYQEVKEKFPLEVPRQDQLEIISEVAYAINKGYKFIIVEAGTGMGKSAISATLARIYESSYILTVTKQLQNQYYNDFKKYGFSLVTGRQNFDCRHHKNVTCDKGDCVLKNKSCDYNLTLSNPLEKLEPACRGYFWKSDTHCPYWTQKVEGLNSKVTIANYDFALYDFNLSHYFKKRRLLILDEAHNLENKIMSFISLDLNRTTLRKDIGLDLDYRTIDKLQNGSVNDWINFVKNVKEKYDDRAKTLVQKAKNNGEDKSFIKDLEKELKIESANRERFINYISNDRKNWICDYDDRQEIISFKPLSVKNYTHDYLFSYGDVCIFMSATILNHKKFAQWMGIDSNEVYSIKKDSPFNSDDNPIIVTDSFNMSRGYLRESAPKTVPVINKILEKHKNEKGLIHTVSKDCRKYIMGHINDDRLMTHTTKNRNKKLEEYKSSKNSVLVSPSMSEGVDLPGEQCRFQIIYKLPFMKLSEQVRQRVKDDEEWYDYRTCIALVQTFGRGIRFDGDYCTTYVVDSRFKDFVRKDKQENQFIPDYVLKAIK